MPTTNPLVAVAFEESECIARGGAVITTYLALVDRVWLPVKRLATAVTRSAAPSPGVVWKRIVEVALPVGTEVERIVESAKRDAHVNTSAVLFGRSKGLQRHRRCTRLVIQRDGLRAVSR